MSLDKIYPRVYTRDILQGRGKVVIRQETREYEHSEWGDLQGRLRVRLQEVRAGFLRLAVQYPGDTRYRPWPGSRGKLAKGTFAEVWAVLERHPALGKRIT